MFTAILRASSLLSNLAGSPRLILEIDIRQLLAVAVFDDKAGVQFFDGPGRRGAAGRFCTTAGRARKEGGRDVDSERLGCIEVDNELEFRGQLHRQIEWSLALEDAAGVAAGEAQRIRTRGSIAHQPAGLGEIAALVDGGYRVARC